MPRPPSSRAGTAPQGRSSACPSWWSPASPAPWCSPGSVGACWRCGRAAAAGGASGGASSGPHRRSSRGQCRRPRRPPALTTGMRSPERPNPERPNLERPSRTPSGRPGTRGTTGGGTCGPGRPWRPPPRRPRSRPATATAATAPEPPHRCLPTPPAPPSSRGGPPTEPRPPSSGSHRRPAGRRPQAVPVHCRAPGLLELRPPQPPVPPLLRAVLDGPELIAASRNAKRVEGPALQPFHPLLRLLRSGVGEGSAEDVGVPEGRRADLLHCGRDGFGLLRLVRLVDGSLLAARLLRVGDRSADPHRLVVQRLAIGVDVRADGGVADVVPDRGAVGAGGRGVDVVAEELGRQVVLAAAPWIAAGAPVDLGEGSDGAVGGDVGVLHHPDQVPRRGGVVAE